MKFYELTGLGEFVPVRLEGDTDKERFQDWVLDESFFEPAPFEGSMEAAQHKLAQLDWRNVGQTQNYLAGAVSQLSPYIEHGLVEPGEILKYIDSRDDRLQAYHFLQQLSWREFYHKKYADNPETVWQDLEPYKTGFKPSEYLDQLPDDIRHATTNVAVINQFINHLMETGYLQNHARLFLAAYIVHWRRVKWQVGARWMLNFLLDGNLASNNYSWQWVASTGSHQPYLFNLEEVQRFASEGWNTEGIDNYPLVGSHEQLKSRLFPRLKQ